LTGGTLHAKLSSGAFEIKDFQLTEKGKVSAKRIQLKPAKIMSTADKGHGQVELFLTAQ